MSCLKRSLRWSTASVSASVWKELKKEDWHLKMKELQADYLQGYFFGKPCEKRKFMEEFVCNPHNNGV